MPESDFISNKNKVKVLISFDLPSELVENVKRVSPRISVYQTTDYAELLALIKDADVLFAGKFSVEMFLSANKLKWIQTSLVGVDRFLFPEVIKSNVVMTNAKSVNAVAVAEHVIALILCLNRKISLLQPDKQ